MNLIEIVKGFYESQGFQVTIKDPTFIIAENRLYGDEIDEVCVWLLTSELRKDKNIILLEEEYLSRFRGMFKKYPRAKLRLLVDTTEGLTQEFKSRAYNECNVKIQVPIQFFDTPFSWEVAENAASATKELSESARKNENKRVQQPYMKKSNPEDGGLDLASDMMHELENCIDNEKPFIWFIIAPAGQGKSFCFESIFYKIYDRFQHSKKHLELFPRPLPLLSSHLKEAAGPTVKGLIDAFIRTEFSANLRREYFNWLIDKRFGILMLDGLDEVITRDSNFIEYLEDRITAPYATPAIIISMRDSLFETCDDLKDFIDDYKEYIDVFILKRWEEKEKRAHAWINLEDRFPKLDDKNTPIVQRYMKTINSSPILQKLSSTPFYADLLIKLFKDDKLTFTSSDEITEHYLINLIIEGMYNRENEKRLINKDVFPPSSYREWLEEIALENYKSKGIYLKELKDLANLSLCLASRPLNDTETNDLISSLLMAPFFKKSDASGKIEFTHELISEYLVGQRLIKYLYNNNTTSFAHLISLKSFPPDSVILSVLVNGLANKLNELAELPCHENFSSDGIRNIIQILLNSNNGFIPIREGLISLEGKNLKDLIFRNKDLRDISFRASDLSNTIFDNCILQNARFEGAIIRGTVFKNSSKDFLKDAKFGDCEHFQSAKLNDKLIDDYDEFIDIISKYTGREPKTEGICPSARQLMVLFRKYIYPDGQARRNMLDRRGVLRGKKEKGAESPEDFLQAAIDFGFLIEEEKGKYIKRAQGDKYGEMVSFIKNQIISPSISSLLDSLCRIPNCRHVPVKKR
ncbi:MAG: pentapeptide repeat-containing protein [Candidatus Saccharicenans sp.]|jgi:hypothetical protein|nr:pentapeptide repeat-containing protein [Candidatus Saccharicenans sp.]MDH7574234.1 pentapeptide repeat-containing protein [Candidatus Saccharicenans sp.]